MRELRRLPWPRVVRAAQPVPVAPVLDGRSASRRGHSGPGRRTCMASRMAPSIRRSRSAGVISPRSACSRKIAQMCWSASSTVSTVITLPTSTPGIPPGMPGRVRGFGPHRGPTLRNEAATQRRPGECWARDDASHPAGAVVGGRITPGEIDTLSDRRPIGHAAGTAASSSRASGAAGYLAIVPASLVCWRSCKLAIVRGVAVLPRCTVCRISRSGPGGSDRWGLDQRP